jgi:hypothetical protein
MTRKGEVRVTLDTKLLDQIVRATGKIREDAVREAALSVQDKAQKNVGGSGGSGLRAVDTGSLNNSIYTTMSFDSQSMPNLKSPVRSKKTGQLIDIASKRVRLPKPKSGRHVSSAHVGPSVNYGIYVEMGTTSNKAGPRPFLGTAMGNVEKEMREELKRLRNGK